MLFPPCAIPAETSKIEFWVREQQQEIRYLCKFEESKNALNKGLELNKEKENLFKNWIKKVEDELK